MTHMKLHFHDEKRDFQFYKPSVFNSHCDATLDLAVAAECYGTECDEDYWLNENSWGSK